MNLNNSTDSDKKILKGSVSDELVLPNSELSNLEINLKEYPNKDFKILDIISDNYYGYKAIENDNSIKEEYVLINSNNYRQTSLNYQSGTKEWRVGSGSAIVMNNRYHYEWKSFTDEFSGNSLHDVRLIRTDGQNGNVEICDEIKQSSPFIYLCKIDDEHFLSYSLCQADSERTDYAVISSASVYSITGEKKEIINERYENDESWSNSEGVLIEQFAINNGEIYGYGRRLIDSEYNHFLYHYDSNGKIEEEIIIEGFENIIGSEQPLDFWYSGNYISFRTYESLSNYICKINDGHIELIMKGMYGQAQYAVIDKYILFIENNVDVYTDKIKLTECLLYIIDTTSDSIKAISLNIPLENPYFVEISALSNDSVVLSYCDNEYNPIYIYQFEIENKSVENVFK